MKLSIHQIAEGLDLPLSTVDRWVRQGRIPTQKSGRELSFDAALLEKWAAGKHLHFSLPGGEKEQKPEQEYRETLLDAIKRGLESAEPIRRVS